MINLGSSKEKASELHAAAGTASMTFFLQMKTVES